MKEFAATRRSVKLFRFGVGFLLILIGWYATKIWVFDAIREFQAGSIGRDAVHYKAAPFLSIFMTYGLIIVLFGHRAFKEIDSASAQNSNNLGVQHVLLLLGPMIPAWCLQMWMKIELGLL